MSSSGAVTPWVYSPNQVYYPFTYEIGCQGSTTVPGYTLPSEKLCLPDWKAPYSDCKWGGKWGTKLECKWVKGETKWYDCWGTPTVELLPNLNVGYQATLPITFYLSGQQIITAAATGQPYTVSQFYIGNFTLKLTVNNVVTNIPVKTANTVTEQNGVFSTEYSIVSISGDFETAGITYNMDFTFSLLGSLYPAAQEGWLNLQVACKLSIDYEGVDDYSINFTTTCPIVTAQES